MKGKSYLAILGLLLFALAFNVSCGKDDEGGPSPNEDSVLNQIIKDNTHEDVNNQTNGPTADNGSKPNKPTITLDEESQKFLGMWRWGGAYYYFRQDGTALMLSGTQKKVGKWVYDLKTRYLTCSASPSPWTLLITFNDGNSVMGVNISNEQTVTMEGLSFTSSFMNLLADDFVFSINDSLYLYWKNQKIKLATTDDTYPLLYGGPNVPVQDKEDTYDGKTYGDIYYPYEIYFGDYEACSAWGKGYGFYGDKLPENTIAYYIRYRDEYYSNGKNIRANYFYPYKGTIKIVRGSSVQDTKFVFDGVLEGEYYLEYVGD